VINTRPELLGSFGMVASTHWLASAAGMSVLERGGNAFDAAVAAGFVLQVVEPHLNGPGGDLPAIVWSAAEARAHVVCGQGVSPAAATIERYAERGLSLVPGTGLLAATVPGAFGAWTTMLERWGSWELADVLAYALYYAETGFPVLPTVSRTIGSVAALFREHWTPSAQTWLDGGDAPRPGTWWRTPALAASYRRVLAEASGPSRERRIESARAAWYCGFVAEEFGRFCATTAWRDTSGREHPGLLRADDLARWEAGIEEPVRVDYADRYEVLKTGPWGQGPVLGQQLRLAESLGLHTLRRTAVSAPSIQAPSVQAEWIHLIAEAAKLAFADREAWYGDSADVPLQALLSRGYASERAALVGEHASLELRPGAPDGRRPRLATLPVAGAVAAGVGEPTLGRIPGSVQATPEGGAHDGSASGDTCHVDVVDRWGNLVSATPSGGWLQSSPVVPALGFPLGTRAQMFYLEPGLPNSLRPGVRPRTTLSPSLALRDGQPWMAFGTPGGDQQDQWQLAFFLDVVHPANGSGDLQTAIDAPMFHTTHFPSSFYPRDAHPGELLVEDRVGAAVIAELGRRGHRVVPAGPWSLGRLSAVAREGDVFRAAANPRGAQGYAIGR
jgi:gamma-glutamyltranspeptidase / glutathione hydrolase